MSNKKRPSKILDDMLDSLNQISKYTKDLTFDDFENSRMVTDATIRNLEILGEASKLLPEDLKNKYPDIPWRKIVAIRNKVIHEYGVVNLEIIWEIVRNELPTLKDKLQKIYLNENQSLEDSVQPSNKKTYKSINSSLT